MTGGHLPTSCLEPFEGLIATHRGLFQSASSDQLVSFLSGVERAARVRLKLALVNERRVFSTRRTRGNDAQYATFAKAGVY
jgi:hypothetical protein